ncbi:hypothetical protein [Bacillus sp. EB600]|uniref:hypothetical protein n=1 Tax=Bacillus sp. EB600 TaxID=2806345 RepID=UPI00210C1ACB|nr:hypothetical protein [Bacillus sp. EB600]MCQ6282031.1 hypothetical protein [Bacillus sp. EB600]
MSEKKGKIIYVDNLIIHAKNVEIVDSENIKVNRDRNIETNEQDHVSRRDPWGFFLGHPSREEGNEQERENKEINPNNRYDHGQI